MTQCNDSELKLRQLCLYILAHRGGAISRARVTLCHARNDDRDNNASKDIMKL